MKDLVYQCCTSPWGIELSLIRAQGRKALKAAKCSASNEQAGARP